MSLIKEYLAAVEEMVWMKFEQRKPHEIRTELNRLRQKHKIGILYLQEEKRIIKSVENEFEDKFILKFTKELINEEFERITDKFEAGVLRAVRRAMTDKNSTETAIKHVRRLGDVSERYIDTVVRTAKGGLVQAQNISKAIGANINHFRYMGPKIDARPFCANLVGKIFTIDEIHKMTGQKGLPVLYFGGGYNCRHRWVAVDENKALLERLNPEDVKWREKDLREDLRKHRKGFERILDRDFSEEEYKETAVSLVKSKANAHIHVYEGEKQFVFFGKHGYAVADTDGTIRGYYHSKDIEKTIKAYKEKKQCKKIL